MGQIVPVDSYIYRHVILPLHYICMQLAVLVSFTRFTVLIENDSAQ